MTLSCSYSYDVPMFTLSFVQRYTVFSCHSVTNIYRIVETQNNINNNKLN